jgi:23S rRNA (cytidine1920-2'-O)/16S rRNA (cytidine1409-2'-O)-methyltransferase
MERTNARYVEQLPEPVSFVTIDVSFISLTLVLPAVCKWLTSKGLVVALIKPQFEADRSEIGEGGIVRDSATHERVIGRIKEFLPTIGLAVCDVCPSPILGAEGNREFLMWARLIS